MDITPVPGFGMAGHAVAGRVARGFFGRLFARAIYAEDGDGRAIVLVSADLWSVPGGLGDRVAELLQRSASTRHLGREQLILAATHTHQGPGNYSTSPLYNAFASPRRGFDRELLEFLAVRVAAAIEGAVASAVPASATLSRGPLTSFVRNRSMEPFRANPEAGRIIAANAELPLCRVHPEYPDPEACRAVDPELVVLAFEEASGRDLIAVAAFVAVHPTVLPARLEVYNSDLFGYASYLSEAAVSSQVGRPVVAFFNGAEGDVSALWTSRDRPDLDRLARQLSQAVVALAGSGHAVTGPIGFQFTEIEISEYCFTDREGRPRCTEAKATPGVAQLGGAEDGRTLFHELGFVEGRYPLSRAATGAKLPAFQPNLEGLPDLTGIATAATPPPERLPIAVYVLGSVALATLPGEFTTVMGHRIRSHLLARAPGKTPILVGLANEYLSYFVTPEEFDLQHYEAASTLFGPASGPAVDQVLGDLAARVVSGSTPPSQRRYRYWLGFGFEKDFGLRTAGSGLYLPGDSLADLLRDGASGNTRRDWPTVCWSEPVAKLEDFVSSGASPLPRVAVLEPAGGPLSIGGLAQDNSGFSLVTYLESVRGSSAAWCASWFVPAAYIAPSPVTIRVDSHDGTSRTSPPFDPAAGAFFHRF